MDVQPQLPVEQRFRDQQPVGADDDRVGVELELRAEALRLLHRDPEPLGRLLRGRGRHLPSAAPRAVRAGEDDADLVPVGQPCEHVGRERRRAREREPHQA